MLADRFRNGATIQEVADSFDKPVQFIWGGADQMFTESWGRTWAEQMNAPIHVFDDANHFLQTTHGPQIVDLVLADEP